MAEKFDSEDEEMSIENDAVMTKYKLAGEISNTVSTAVSISSLQIGIDLSC